MLILAFVSCSDYRENDELDRYEADGIDDIDYDRMN